MVVRPVIMYSLEIVGLTKRSEAELDVAELKMLSAFETKMDRISHEYIRGTARVEQLERQG